MKVKEYFQNFESKQSMFESKAVISIKPTSSNLKLWRLVTQQEHQIKETQKLQTHNFTGVAQTKMDALTKRGSIKTLDTNSTARPIDHVKKVKMNVRRVVEMVLSWIPGRYFS
jgi:hypothetical protein